MATITAKQLKAKIQEINNAVDEAIEEAKGEYSFWDERGAKFDATAEEYRELLLKELVKSDAKKMER